MQHEGERDDAPREEADDKLLDFGRQVRDHGVVQDGPERGCRGDGLHQDEGEEERGIAEGGPEPGERLRAAATTTAAAPPLVVRRLPPQAPAASRRSCLILVLRLGVPRDVDERDEKPSGEGPSGRHGQAQRVGVDARADTRVDSLSGGTAVV